MYIFRSSRSVIFEFFNSKDYFVNGRWRIVFIYDDVLFYRIILVGDFMSPFKQILEVDISHFDLFMAFISFLFQHVIVLGLNSQLNFVIDL